MTVRSDTRFAGDPSESGIAPRTRFWRSYIGIGFAILAGESAAVVGYLLISPGGTHRQVLTAVAASAFAAAILGMAISGAVAKHAWRTSFVLASSSLTVVALAAAAYLDGGIDSPLLFLTVLPVMYAALVLRPAAVTAIGIGVMATFVAVGVTDQNVSREARDLVMLSAVVIGAVLLAVVSAIIRARLQAEEAALMAELDRRASVDDLTQCWRYGPFNDRLRKEVDRAVRYRHGLSLMICDVDFLRDYNDMFGHLEGDAALAEVGDRLRSAARSTDIVARLGGDEFAILLPESSASDAAELAGRLTGDSASATGLGPTLSIGISELDPTEPTPKRLYRDADAAMYEAKANGRHAFVVASGPTAPLPTRSPFECDRTRLGEVARQARRERLEAETILDILISEAPVGIAFVDLDYRVLRINQALAARSQAAPADLVGQLSADVIPHLWPQLERGFHEVIRTGLPLCNIEVVAPPSPLAGTPPAVLTSLYPVHVGSRIIGTGVVVVDITDRKRVEESQVALTDAVVSALAAAAEARDPYTAGHQRRVAKIALAIATSLGHDEAAAKGIGLSAAIHDIGKVAIPAEILSRPGRLGAAEMELVRTHAEAGYSILQGIEFPWPVADMVRQHHERLDGSGYPLGLTGEQICTGARIIAVADVVEAMSAHRPYRPAQDIESALAYIQEGRGTLFDPAAVDACVVLFRSGALQPPALVAL